jgi:small subunit ribosomal protein S6
VAANVYECMLILDSNKYNGDPAGVVSQLHGILERHKCEILASRVWDERRLTYPISGHKKGTYYLIYFRGDGRNLREVEQDFHLTESILRFLNLQIRKQLVDTMLAVARDEHALAIQTPGLTEEPVEAVAAVPAAIAEEE